MDKASAIVLLVALFSLSLVEGFNFERDVLSHFRSKRDTALKRVCAAELYSGNLNSLCKVPPFVSHAAPVAKCLAKLKQKSIADGEPVCIFDCVFQENKWSTAAGVLDYKKIEADFVKGVGAPWAPIATAACKKCSAETTKRAAAPKLASGYATACKAGSYMMQTCVVVEMIANCPAAMKSPSYEMAKPALVGCDAFAPAKTEAERAAALKAVDPSKALSALKGQDPKALLAKLPAGMAGMIPKGMDMNSPQAKALMANPSALAGKIPAGMMAMLG